MQNTVELNNENFIEIVINSSKPFLVNFYTSEEDTQHSFERVMEEIATSQDKVCIGKIDSFKHKQVSDFFSAKTFPTLILFEDGNIIDYCVGEAYADQVKNRFSKYFA